MILLPTLWETVKWKKVLLWYTVISLFFWFNYDPTDAPLAIAIMAHIGVTIFAIMTIFSVWSSVITGRIEGFPIVWIFSIIVKDIRIFEKVEGARLMEMKHWCEENCIGKWRHCEHGYFVFRKKIDAMGFRLTWS